MDIEIKKLTESSDPIEENHHNNQDEGLGGGECQNEGNLSANRNLNYNINNSSLINQQEDKQKDCKQPTNGRWNQFASSKLGLKSRVKKSPSESQLNQNYKNLQNQSVENDAAVILTQNNQSKLKTEPTNEKDISIKLKERYFFEGDIHHQHENGVKKVSEKDNYCNKLSLDDELDLDANVNVNINKNNSPSSNNTSWNRIFQCFSVFKPRKISSTNPNSSGQVVETGGIGTAEFLTLKKPHPELIMTDLDQCLQELADNSEILSRSDARNLGNHFPPRAIGNVWEKTFSSTTDGFSLHNLYRKLDGIDSPVLLIVEDIDHRVFGAVLSTALKVSENFYGNCDTFLFRARPDFDVFKWSGDNFYFIQGQDNFISVGSDDGRYGLWLDDNLYLGRTEECSTFSSPALVPEKDFKIKTVECWTVGLV